MNARQHRFVEAYLVDPNAAEAARRAGYSQKTADRIGSRLLRNVEIAGKVREAQDARAERTKITEDMVVQELALHAFGSMGDFYNPTTGRLLELHEMPPRAQARLSSIRVLRKKTHTTTAGVTETSVHESTVQIKLWDKLRALELLGRHLGMFRDKVEHTGDVSLLEICRRIEAEEDAAKQRHPPSLGL